jgi:hypothetical protein
LAILEKEVYIKLHNKAINHYEKLGYEIPRYVYKGALRVKRGTAILIKVNDLPPQSNVKLTKICDECGVHINGKPYSQIINHRSPSDGKDRCRSCGTKLGIKLLRDNLPYEKSLEYFSIIHQKKNLIEEFSDKNETQPSKVFKGSNDLYFWNCFDCGSEYSTSANSRTNNNSGCPYCAGQKVNHTNSLGVINPELSREWHPYKNEEMTPFDITTRSNRKVWWKCKKCNYEWRARPSTRSKGVGCLQCKEPKGEKRIKKWLKENKIEHIPHKRFKGLVGTGGGLLSYDFYLPNENLLIEYQGQFHDGNGWGIHSKINLPVQKEHDKRKKEYSAKHNIKLLEIWYWDFNSIEQILSKIIKTN